MKIIFFGTGKFGIPTLRKILNDQKYHVELVVTQPDSKKGRGMNVVPTYVKAFIEQASPATPVSQPVDIKDPSFIKELKTFKADVFVVVDYGQILRKEVLASPAKFCINLHPSLLPKYRGAAPVNWAIMNGETETGVTVIKMDEGMDSGSIMAQEKIRVSDDENAERLSERLSQSGADLIIKVLGQISEGKENFTEQDAKRVSFAPRLKKQDGEIDWKAPAIMIFRKIIALQPWPGAYTKINGKALRVIEARVTASQENVPPGTVISEEEFIVKAGENAIILDTVQLEGKKTMSKWEFLRGHKLNKGVVLGA
ncbi:MAG TPA: methionyl-tRNA formyltransferase [Candidatus Omnitrophota bacterium]|nr:methionyl-tRNA formyltransferase [Candidatus Omnitrophota bacterium]HPS19572.1 methionyl-tRNA formyltransferase [Candidatus Omnitrophota bacterium]